MMKLKILLLLISAPTFIFSQGKDNLLTAKEQKNGWQLLFDGTTMNGWTTTQGKPITKGWSIESGSLTAWEGGKGGDIVTVNEYDNFTLTLDFKIAPGCNSGVKYFYTRYTNGGNLGLEYQILDDKLAEDNKKDNHLCGSLYDILAPNEKIKSVKQPGEWNTIKIVATGMKVEHWLNGKRILTFTRGDKAFTADVAKSKFNTVIPAFGSVEKGKILLQEHGGTVSFKNIKIKTL